VEEDAALLARLWPQGYAARPEQAILFHVEAWDSNCAQHIPQLFPAADVGQTILQFQARIRELEDEVTRLRAQASSPRPAPMAGQVADASAEPPSTASAEG
jgi:hypothetical protein